MLPQRARIMAPAEAHGYHLPLTVDRRVIEHHPLASFVVGVEVAGLEVMREDTQLLSGGVSGCRPSLLAGLRRPRLRRWPSLRHYRHLSCHPGSSELHRPSRPIRAGSPRVRPRTIVGLHEGVGGSWVRPPKVVPLPAGWVHSGNNRPGGHHFFASEVSTLFRPGAV
jgi:hypothetical protein